MGIEEMVVCMGGYEMSELVVTGLIEEAWKIYIGMMARYAWSYAHGWGNLELS